MTFSIEGDCFETCCCGGGCCCGPPATGAPGACDVFLAWRLTRGHLNGVTLRDLNLALAVQTPGELTAGGWKATLYVDERADPEQRKALGAIFSIRSGGLLGVLAPLIDELVGPCIASISLCLADRDRAPAVTISNVHTNGHTGGEQRQSGEPFLSYSHADGLVSKFKYGG